MSYAAGCLSFGVILQAAASTAMPIFGVASLGVVAWSVTLERDCPQRVERHGRLGTVGAVFRAAPKFWQFLLALLLVWTGFNAAWNFIALKIADEGGGPMLVGSVWRSEVWSSADDAVLVRLQARWGLRRVFVLGCLVYATGFLLWGTVSNPTIVSMLAVFGGSRSPSCSRPGGRRRAAAALHPVLDGQRSAQMVGFRIGPIIGAGIGGSSTRGGAVTLARAHRSSPSEGDRRVDRAVHPALSRPSTEVPRSRPRAARSPAWFLGSLGLPGDSCVPVRRVRSGSHRMGSSLRRGGCRGRAYILIQTEVGRAVRSPAS
jgi:hypothetical protein